MEEILIRHAEAYEKHDIRFMLGRRVTGIDRAKKSLSLDNGETLTYDKLALCVGARVRKHPLVPEGIKNAFYLRTVEDIEHIRAALKPGGKAVIIGGGYIGLETAASLKKLGVDVSVLEMAPRVMARVTCEEISQFYERVHAEEGVQIRTDCVITGIKGTDRVEGVELADGETIEADVLIVGIGVEANTELARDTGLEVSNGIHVNAGGQTDDPDIYAAGDCTYFQSPQYGWLRLESVANAIEQAKAAAASICGKPLPNHALPWFWSDQYDVKLQIAGFNAGYDEVLLRGDNSSGRSFTAFYLKKGVVIAADCVNRPGDFMISKRLVAEQAVFDASQLRDESIPLKQILEDHAAHSKGQ